MFFQDNYSHSFPIGKIFAFISNKPNPVLPIKQIDIFRMFRYFQQTPVVECPDMCIENGIHTFKSPNLKTSQKRS